MKIIKQLSEYIEEELEDSEKYILKALEYKSEYPDTANTFYQLSVEEIRHMNLLHDQVVRLIEDYKRTSGSPPEAMQAIYDFLHKRFITQTKEIKIMQEMYQSK